MLLGLCTRAATAVSFVASLALASLSFAASTRWSHQYNVVFLAQAAFLGARGGDVLSIDALIRMRRGLPLIDRARAYQWSVRLVQLAVAVMFACAAFHKLLHGHFTLRWALSDNLRHQLLVRFDLAGLPRPPLVDWIIDDPWRYRTAAVLNLDLASGAARRVLPDAPAGVARAVRCVLHRRDDRARLRRRSVEPALAAALRGVHRLGLAASASKPIHDVPPPGWQPARAIRGSS